MSARLGGGSLLPRLAAVAVFASTAAWAQHDESSMFGQAPVNPMDAGTAQASAADAGTLSTKDEAAMFGEEPKPALSPVQQATPGPKSGADESAGLLTGQDAAGLKDVSNGPDAFTTGEAGAVNPLTIGGQLYLRGIYQDSRGTPPSQATVSWPTLVDGYLDARPNDRVRGFVLARMQYDPSLNSLGQSVSSTTALLGSSSVSPFTTSSNPGIALDQAWLRFDIAHTVFVTAGQQHVRWGVGRFWSPTDYLTPQFRNPLLPFDPRVGASMIKLHLPIEKLGWNFYALALLDNQGPAGLFGQLGGAGRAEFLLGQWELGLDGVYQRVHDAVNNLDKYTGRYGLDLSGPIWLFDVWGEFALRPDYPFVQYGLNDPNNVFAGAKAGLATGLEPAVTLRAEIGIPYSANLTLTVGAEYFYNSVGYTDPKVYPWLIFNGAFVPFYLGQQYAAIYASTPAPWDKDFENLTLSNLGNLSDGSFLSRVDYSIRILQKLTLEAYVAYHYGNPTGEFHLGLDNPTTITQPVPAGGTCPAPSTLAGGSCVIPAFHVAPPALELGIGARIAI